MKMDFSNILTVFLISCGDNPNFDDCLEMLKNQTISFNLQIIKDVSPLPVAFQKMIDDCTTKYYIEIDEDMIMQANSIELMMNFMIDCEKRDKNIAMCSFKLKDIHSGEEIYGVKVYRHDILKKYPYNLQHPSCEVEQINRFKADGYINFLSPWMIGKHSPKWTNELIYERYNNLMRKFSIYRYQWMEKLPIMLLEKVMKEPTKENIFALLGAYQGVLDGGLEIEKNLSVKNNMFMKFLPYVKRPNQTTLYITSKCNFKCDFCVRQHNGIEKSPDMTVDMVGNLLFKFPTIMGACLCGFGEPLMSDNLVPILQCLRERGVFAGLITNGSLLKSRYDELAEQSLGYLSVSLNGYDAKSHEKTTKTKTWEDVIEGIKMVLADKRFDLYVSYILNKTNLSDVGAVIELCNNLGIKNLYFHNILPHFNVNEDGNFSDLVLTTDDANIIDGLKRCDIRKIVKRWPILLDGDEGRSACRFPFDSIQINGNGSIGLCNSVIPCDKKFGNINDFVVWNNEPLEKFREDYLSNNIPQCRKCFRHWCSK